jgi:hypothetical protein
MISEGKTGNIHGIEVKARAVTRRPTANVSTHSSDGREAVLQAARRVYEEHHAVIQALANR